MAGEWSKKIGEAGESIVAEFLNMIGWVGVAKGIDVKCVRGVKHKISETPRSSHGLDYLYSYKSPLFDSTVCNVVISVKYTAAKYPSPPAPKFKDHFSELTAILECFRNSSERTSAQKRHAPISHVKDVGLLFWFTGEGKDFDVIAQLQSIALPDENQYSAVYLVDNRRMAFLYNAIGYARSRFVDYDVEFYYHDTGYNPNPITKKTSGAILPVELITSTLLALKLDPQTGSDSVLFLTLDEDFSEANLRRLMGLAQKLSGNWASKIFIGFAKYDSLIDANDVEAVRNSFDDAKMAKKVNVFMFNGDFRSLNNPETT